MPREGGRYVIDENGEKQLLERTDWAPPASAKTTKPKTETKEVNDDAFSEKVHSGED